MKYIIKTLTILSIILTLMNCSRETVDDATQEQRNRIREDIDFGTVSLKETLTFLKAVQADIAYKNNTALGLDIDLGSLHQVDISDTDAKLNVASATTKFDNVESQVLQIMIDGTLQTVLFHVIPESNSENNGVSKVVSENNFTGNIVITDLSGVVLNNFEYHSGTLTGEINLSSYNDDPEPCWGIGCGIALEEVVVTPPAVSPYYYAYSYNANTSNIYNVYQWNRSMNNYSTMGIAYANYYRQKAIKEFEDKIKDDLLNPCLKAIMADLKNINQGAGVIINKFAGNAPGFNWEVKDGSLNGQNALTDAAYDQSTKTVTTTFNTQAWPNATNLSWARTVLHESVHAYIVASFGTNYVQAQETFADLYREFEERAYPDANALHHAELVRNYVNDIALSLQAYGLAEGYSLSNQFYQDMAWGGLTHWKKRDESGNIVKDEQGNPVYEETSWFKDNFPDEADRTRILNTITTELTGEDTNGNAQTQKGENAGC